MESDMDSDRGGRMSPTARQGPPHAAAEGWVVGRCRHAPVTWVAPQGEVDRDAAPLLHHRLAVAVDDGTDVVLDLSAVTFLDCAGVRAVLMAHHAAAAAGRTVTLLAPRPIVGLVLQVTGLDTVLRVIGGVVADDGGVSATAGSGRR
jgi:anti-anti-sigma factor